MIEFEISIEIDAPCLLWDRGASTGDHAVQHVRLVVHCSSSLIAFKQASAPTTRCLPSRQYLDFPSSRNRLSLLSVLSVVSPKMPAQGDISQREDARPSSAPPLASLSSSSSRDSSVLPPLAQRVLSESVTLGRASAQSESLDLMHQLQRSGPSVVKTRTGSVLSRGFILKTDHYPSGKRMLHPQPPGHYIILFPQDVLSILN